MNVNIEIILINVYFIVNYVQAFCFEIIKMIRLFIYIYCRRKKETISSFVKSQLIKISVVCCYGCLFVCFVCVCVNKIHFMIKFLYLNKSVCVNVICLKYKLTNEKEKKKKKWFGKRYFLNRLKDSNITVSQFAYACE